MKKLKICLLIGLFVYLFIGSIAARAGVLSLSVDPSIIEIKVIPPATASNSIGIHNKSESQVTLKIQLNPFKSNLENGELEYLNSQEYPEIFSDIKILDGDTPIDSITLGPKQQKKLTLSITVLPSSNQPNEKTAGVAGEVGRDYYFSIIFISQSSSSAQSNSSLNQIGLATNVLLAVGPKETPNAVLEEFSSNLFFEKGPVPFTVRVKNQGIHFIKPKGEIIIKNMFGQNIGKLDLVNVNILSDSTRAIPNTTYMEELNSDFKNPKALWKENFLLGFYEAKLNLSLSNDGPNFTKSIHFFAFPFYGLIIIVILAIAAIIIRKRLKIYMNKSAVKI